MSDVLSFEAQTKILAGLDAAALLHIPGARVIFEIGTQSDKAADLPARQSSSGAPCYAELVVGSVVLQMRASGGQWVTTQFIFRDYRMGSGLKIDKQSWRVALTHFPGDATEDSEAGKNELTTAFAFSFQEFVRVVAK